MTILRLSIFGWLTGVAVLGLAGCTGFAESNPGAGLASVDPQTVLPPDIAEPATPLPGQTTYPTVLPPFSPPPARLRILLSTQYRNSIRELLGSAAAAAVTPPPDSSLNGFNSIGASQFELTPFAVSAYEKSAFEAARIALADTTRRAALIGCTPVSPTDDACWTSFVQRFGRLAWRGQWSAEDVAPLVALGKKSATAYSNFYSGAEFVVAALLQSTRFLQQTEFGAPSTEHPGSVKLTGTEMASRLSFFLRNSAPSAELLAAGDSGALATAEGVRAQAQALLSGTGPKSVVEDFFHELLGLANLAQAQKDSTTYPAFSTTLAQDMGQETRTLVSTLAVEDADFRTVFDASFSFVNAPLAQLYGMPSAGTGFVRAELPPTQGRGGLLGQAAFLSLFAHNASSSPTLRGRLVREKMLCQSIPAPPPEVVTVLPVVDPSNPQTARDRLQFHRQNASCAGCHALMDDIGLGLENYDGIGQYRTTEFGLAINATSPLDDLGTFTGARQLGGLLKTMDRAHECMVRNLFRYGTGHIETNGELRPLKAVTEAYVSSGYKARTLLSEFVGSDAFRFAGIDLTAGGN
jgi:hypothetical protein